MPRVSRLNFTHLARGVRLANRLIEDAQKAQRSPVSPLCTACFAHRPWHRDERDAVVIVTVAASGSEEANRRDDYFGGTKLTQA
jgi:hypothetical protein